MAARRIVSLLPSATEIVHALGLGDRLVGRSHECDFPPGVDALPVCTRPRRNMTGSSADIDRRVKQALAEAASVYEVIEDRLAALAPDAIVTQDQCEVCAVSLADVERAVAGWTGCDTRIVSLRPNCLDDVYGDIRRAADILGVAAEGVRVVEAMAARIDAVAAATRDVAERPSVACIEWCEPLMAAGNWVPEQVALAGGRDLFGTAGQHAPWLDEAALLAADPDVVVFMPCGFDLERTEAEARALLARPGWDQLGAVATGRVFATDANAYFNRPGPRRADSVEILAEILHPGRGTFGHGDCAWRRL